MKLKNDILLGVNIDHVASLRQARLSQYPDTVQAAFIAEQAGADAITIHLREDRRHIQDRDVMQLKQTIQTRMNLEMAVTDEMLSIAEQVCPQDWVHRVTQALLQAITSRFLRKASSGFTPGPFAEIVNRSSSEPFPVTQES